jgi:hypothetical protein
LLSNFGDLNSYIGRLISTFISTDNFPNNVGIYISIVFIIIAVYIIYKVRKSIKDEGL